MSKKVRDKRKPKCKCGRTMIKIDEYTLKCPLHERYILKWQQRPEFQGLQRIRGL